MVFAARLQSGTALFAWSRMTVVQTGAILRSLFSATTQQILPLGARGAGSTPHSAWRRHARQPGGTPGMLLQKIMSAAR
jgi:hypothetical protein